MVYQSSPNRQDKHLNIHMNRLKQMFIAVLVIYLFIFYLKSIYFFLNVVSNQSVTRVNVT